MTIPNNVEIAKQGILIDGKLIPWLVIDTKRKVLLAAEIGNRPDTKVCSICSEPILTHDLARHIKAHGPQTEVQTNANV